MTFPQTPGFKGSAETSRLGAERAKRTSTTRQAEALDAITRLGVASAEEVAEVTGHHWYLTRPRLSELSAQGLITDAGSRGKGAMGGKVIRWRLTSPEERAAFAAEREGRS